MKSVRPISQKRGSSNFSKKADNIGKMQKRLLLPERSKWAKIRKY